MKNVFLFAVVMMAFVACSSSEKKNDIDSQVQAMMEKHEYREALQLLSNLPSTEQTTALALEIRKQNQAFLEKQIAELKAGDLNNAETKAKLAKAHLDYGIFLEYYGEHLGMRERMTGSLAHLRRSLQLDPESEKAKAEIGQIENIYKQMGREVPQEIAE
ncbi:hypothetical protein EP331_04030 [bacterium]|nr:MAG: hypothetical protein EP331_04030 [bacterium]